MIKLTISETEDEKILLNPAYIVAARAEKKNNKPTGKSEVLLASNILESVLVLETLDEIEALTEITEEEGGEVEDEI